MPGEPDWSIANRESLAEALRELRRAAGLTGERLAVRASISQSKISRIETGETLPSAIDVERILNALEVPPQIRHDLIELARRANIDYKSWRVYARTGIWRKQDELKSLEASAKVMRHFLPAIPTGLLHVYDYAVKSLGKTVPSENERDPERLARARLERQSVLDDPSKRFIFLLTEQAVRWRRADSAVMARQVARMADISSTKPTVDIAIIPQHVEVDGSPMNVFVAYDDRMVVVELFSGEVVLRDPRDIRHHLELFDFFLGHALTGDDATRFLLSVEDEFMRERG